MRIERLREQLSAAITRWYAPREVLIRSDGRVKYVVLSANRQIAATAIAGAFALSLICAVAGWTISDYRLGDRDQEVATAKAAYVELLAEVSQSYEGFAALARSLETNESALLTLIKGKEPQAVDMNAIEAQLARSQMALEEGLAGSVGLKDKLRMFESDLHSVVDRNEQLRQSIVLLQQQLAAAEADKLAIFQSREQLGSRLTAAEAELAGAYADKSALDQTIDALERDLALARDAGAAERAAAAELRRQLAGAERALAAQLATAESRLADSDAENAALDQTIEDLERELADARQAGAAERTGAAVLRQQVASLAAQLDGALDRGVRVDRRLTETQRHLEALRNQRRELELVRNQLGSEVKLLQTRIATMESSQQSIVQRLAERTRSGADEVEKTVAMTGIDVDALLTKLTPQLTGLGGPFVPARGRLGESGAQTILASVAPLDLEMSRWEQLQVILRSIPLNTPLDHYTIGSTYGMRKDPFNSKLAMHEGLDFSAPLGSPVLATAPGKVVFAGRKGSYGRMVEIDHGFGIHTRYAHLKEILVEVGQTVEYRDKIGKLGNSGRSTGPHVHYEILVDGVPYDPMNFLKAGRYVFKG